ncbi:hypothetical protein ACMFMG_007302 [Clarireedia jacksonii]
MIGNVCLSCRALLAQSARKGLVRSSIARGYSTIEGPKDYLGTNFEDDAPTPQEKSQKDRFIPRSVKLHGTKMVTPLSEKPSDKVLKIRRVNSVMNVKAHLPSVVNVDELLAKPTWSVRSLLPSRVDADFGEVTTAQLHHLCRLSALPVPTSQEEEESLLRTLHTQLHFLKNVQKVDTEGVEPLRSIRDETQHAESAAMIGLNTEEIQQALAKEEYRGRNRRPRRRTGTPIDTENLKDWDVFSTAQDKVELGGGKYFVSAVVEELGSPEVMEGLPPINDVRVVELNDVDDIAGPKDEGTEASSTDADELASAGVTKVQVSIVEGKRSSFEVEGEDGDIDSAVIDHTSLNEIEKKEA